MQPLVKSILRLPYAIITRHDLTHALNLNPDSGAEPPVDQGGSLRPTGSAFPWSAVFACRILDHGSFIQQASGASI